MLLYTRFWACAGLRRSPTITHRRERRTRGGSPGEGIGKGFKTETAGRKQRGSPLAYFYGFHRNIIFNCQPNLVFAEKPELPARRKLPQFQKEALPNEKKDSSRSAGAGFGSHLHA